MLQLYFFPMACSLASRIALMEAGIDARYHLVHLWNKKVLEGDGDFWAVSPKGAVPVLVLENGERLTENAAVLQYIADLRPERSGSRSSAPRSTRPFCFQPSGMRTKRPRRARESASERTCQLPPSTLKAGNTSSASASPWRMRIWRGRCCCSSVAASM